VQCIAREIADGGRSEVISAYVDAVRTSGKRDIRPIIDIDRNGERSAQSLGEREQRRRRDTLRPELHGRHTSGFSRGSSRQGASLFDDGMVSFNIAVSIC
jgi:hypothetical protein